MSDEDQAALARIGAIIRSLRARTPNADTLSDAEVEQLIKAALVREARLDPMLRRYFAKHAFARAAPMGHA